MDRSNIWICNKLGLVYDVKDLRSNNNDTGSSNRENHHHHSYRERYIISLNNVWNNDNYTNSRDDSTVDILWITFHSSTATTTPSSPRIATSPRGTGSTDIFQSSSHDDLGSSSHYRSNLLHHDGVPKFDVSIVSRNLQQTKVRPLVNKYESDKADKQQQPQQSNVKVP